MSKIDLIHGDCLVEMQRIPDKSIDMVLCDLPYGTTACKWDVVIPFDKLWEQYNRIVKTNGAIVLFGQEPFSTLLRMSNLSDYKYDWIWHKEYGTGFQLANVRPLISHEIISVFSKGCTYPLSKNKIVYNPQGLILNNGKKRNKRGGKGGYLTDSGCKCEEYIPKASNYPNSVLFFNRDKSHNHPTQKPVALLEYLIKTYSNEGDTILDNTMGSGSTMVACVNTKRNGIGIELDDNYFKIAQERVKQAQQQLTLF